MLERSRSCYKHYEYGADEQRCLLLHAWSCTLRQQVEWYEDHLGCANDLSEVNIHPAVTLDHVSIVGLSIFQLH